MNQMVMSHLRKIEVLLCRLILNKEIRRNKSKFIKNRSKKLISSNPSSTKEISDVHFKSSTPIELPEVKKKNSKFVDNNLSIFECNEGRRLDLKDNNTKQNRNKIYHQRYKSVNNRPKEKKQIPALKKFNKILNFSIEKEIKSIVGHLENVPQNHKQGLNHINLKSGINSGQNLDKELKKQLKVSFELPEL